MQNLIQIKDLTFRYEQKIIFNRLNLEIEENSYITIVGPNGSGKSTLVRIILGLLKTDSYINIDNIELKQENLKDIRKKIGVVFENPDNQFVAETVMDDIAFSLENMEEKPKTIQKKVKDIANYLGIYHLLEKEPHSLSGGQKQLVALASALVIEPKILILDEALTMVDPEAREEIYKILLQLHQEKNLTIINVTHDMDETLYGDDILVLDNGKIILKGKKELVLQEEKLFHELGLDLPFMAELSIKLKYYNLIDHMILNMDEMVDELWK